MQQHLNVEDHCRGTQSSFNVLTQLSADHKTKNKHFNVQVDFVLQNCIQLMSSTTYIQSP